MRHRLFVMLAAAGIAAWTGLALTRTSLAVGYQAASTAPEQLRIAYGEDPTSMMRVVWQTQAPTTNPTVEYGATQELGMSALGKRVSYAYETGAIAEATLHNLKPDTTYYYRAGDLQGGWSATHTFRTAPEKPKEFVFTAFGDHGVAPDSAKNVQNVLAEKPAFHVLLGDISYANGTQPVWDQYFAQIEPMACTIPVMPALGNHENEQIMVNGVRQRIGYVAYLARFALPGGEQSYWFDYGPARFVSFNSDDYLNPAQLKWLDDTLADARRARHVKWIVVFQHHPLYGSSQNRNDNTGLIRTVLPLYDRHRVDLVLSGHDHHYERQYPMRGGQVTSREKTGYRKGEGTLYVKHGGGGKSLYDFTPAMPDVCAFREKSSGYLRVTVRRDGPLMVEAKRLDGSLMEKIEIKR
jgi:hypothetical protein